MINNQLKMEKLPVKGAAFLITTEAKELAAAKKANNGIELVIARLNAEDHHERTLAAIITDIGSTKCNFCKGEGHHSGECATLKNINTAVKKMPLVRKVWGTMKALYKSTGRKTAVQAATN